MMRWLLHVGDAYWHAKNANWHAENACWHGYDCKLKC